MTVDAGASPVAGQVEVTLAPAAGGRPIATATVPVNAAASTSTVATATLPNLPGIDLWSPEHPALYRVDAALSNAGGRLDQTSVRTGFREASFEVDGFYLNGRRYLLFGLNRHQLYPYGGMSMPERVQRRDAQLLRQVLNCNMVRCSHYPQSPAFLDACDELGLLVWEEVPGWGYIGDSAWKDLWFGNVTAMVVRDRNRPSVVIWGAQPNETFPAVADATTAKQLAKASDPDRPTGGTQTRWNYPNYVQDVYAYDDYGSTPNPDGTVTVHLQPRRQASRISSPNRWARCSRPISSSARTTSRVSSSRRSSTARRTAWCRIRVRPTLESSAGPASTTHRSAATRTSTSRRPASSTGSATRSRAR